jgi:uncharacterized protein YjbJ (UPF0337 family)
MASGLYWWDPSGLPHTSGVETPFGVTDSPTRIVSPAMWLGTPGLLGQAVGADAGRHGTTHDREERIMGSNTDDLKGRIKEGVGAATDDRDLEREGKLDRAGGAVKDAAEKAKDKVADGVDAVKDKLNDRR